MKRAFAAAIVLAATPLLAVDTDDCLGLLQLRELYAVRNILLKHNSSSYAVSSYVDRRLEQLREPLPGGGYRWVRWVRPPGDGPEVKKGHLAAAVHDKGDSDPFEASGDHAFAVRVEVPEKKSLFSRNAPVYVGNVHMEYEVKGRPRTMDKRIDQWMNPDTSRTFDLEAIADRVTVSLDSGAPSNKVREALVEIHIRQAVPEDDPASPAYPVVSALHRLRDSSDDLVAIDDQIASLEHSLIPDASPLPLLSIVNDLRHADELRRSKKTEDQEKGEHLLKETLRRLR